MGGASSIRAGGAYVEVRADHRQLGPDLAAAEGKVRDYGKRINQLNAAAVQAVKSGDLNRATGYALAAKGLQERQAGLAGDAERLREQAAARALSPFPATDNPPRRLPALRRAFGAACRRHAPT